MPYVSSNSPLVKAFIDLGLIPPHCAGFSLCVTPNDVARLRYEVFATEEQFAAVVKAIEENPEDAQRIAKEVSLTDPFWKHTVTVPLKP